MVEYKGYKYIVNEENSFTIYFHGEEIHKSRNYRLRVQADGQAKEWIDREVGTPVSEVTLDVQNLSIDAKTFFRRMNNG